MSDDPNYDPATTAAAESPSKPIPPAVQAALDAAIARIETLEKYNAIGNEIGARLLKSLVANTTPLGAISPTTVVSNPGPFTNTPATAAATEALQTDPAAPLPPPETPSP